MISNSLRIRSKLLTINSFVYNKSSNVCLYPLIRICVKNKSNKLNSNYNLITMRCLVSNANNKEKSSTTALSESQRHSELTIGEKVKQTTRDVSYLGVILGGLTVTSLIFYAVFKELFSSNSPNVIYSNALKRCKSDPRVIEAIGQPIKGFGEMTSRGRRRHVSALEYEKDGNQLIRVKFYLKGSKKSGTVHLETLKNSPKSEYRYLFVQMDSYPNHTIVLEDNRST